MNRGCRAVLMLGVVLGVVALVCAGGLFLVSGGRPIDFVQKALIRVSLASRQADLNTPAGSSTKPQRFTVASGDTPRTIAQKLAAANLITDPSLFVDYVRLNDIDKKLQAGTYFLKQSLTPVEIAAALQDASSTQFPFRILEGWRIEEIAAAIDDNSYFPFTGRDFLAAVGPGATVNPSFASRVMLPSGASLEGFLFPDTYQLPAEITPELLRDTLTQAFLDKVGAQVAADAAAQGLTLYQAVTLASIVQREAVHEDEQPLIASVYRNRMRDGMKLEADPTVQYAMGFTDGRWWPRITVDNYSNVNSPYNTYLHAGLPPGPISNPGLSAIRAAVYPAQSDYYYFRADCSTNGYHKFARTFEEHLANCS